MQYRREIDGLRAVAVLPVIFFHAGFQTFSGGFIGVDVFFVISGYLITSIILMEKEAGIFTLAGFYERRARRILPALFTVLLVCIPLAWFSLLPRDVKAFSKSLIGVSTFSSNILFGLESGYFDTAAELKPLLHTWSLAVEEQFYLLFPVFILSVWRFGKRWLLGILATAAIVSITAAHWGAIHKPSATFFFLPTRGWELIIGSFSAFCLLNNKSPHIRTPIVCQILGFIGLALIVFPVFMFDKNTPFPSLYALFPTVGTALIIFFVTPDTMVGKVLGSKILVGVGLISYSAYLWHQPLFSFTKYIIEDPEPYIFLILSMLSIIFAYFSWKIVETPFRNRNKIGKHRVFVFSLAGTCLFITIGFIGYFNNGFDNYYINHRLDESARRVYQIITRYSGGDMYLDMVDNGDCNFWAKAVDENFEKRFDECAARFDKAIVILGDSHAMNIYNSLARSKHGDFVVGVSQGGCRPLDNNPNCHYDKFDSFAVNNRKKINYIVFHQSGLYLIRDYLGDIAGSEIFDKNKNYEICTLSIQKTSDYLSRLSEFNNVVWLGPFVETVINFRNTKLLINNGFKFKGATIEVFNDLERALKDFHSHTGNSYRYLSLLDVLEIGSDSLIVDDCLTYRDQDHFSICGETLFGKKISNLLRETNG